jgi:hypothetical protein
LWHATERERERERESKLDMCLNKESRFIDECLIKLSRARPKGEAFRILTSREGAFGRGQ